MLLNKRTSEIFTPLYLLASLGAGGMAVALDVHPSVIWPERYLNTTKREPKKPLHLMTTTENSGT